MSIYYSMLQCVAVYSQGMNLSALRYVAVRCITHSSTRGTCVNVLQYVAVRCSEFRRNESQYVAVCCSVFTRNDFSVCCGML